MAEDQQRLLPHIDSPQRPLVVTSNPRDSPRNMRRRVFEDKAELHKFRTQGHASPILAISSSANTDYIVSGSEDGTMRIWRYAQGASFFQIRGILRHGPQTKVTAVAFGGNKGPAICGTDAGDIFFLCLGTQIVEIIKGLHDSDINEIQIIRDTTMNSWIVLTGSRDMKAKVLSLYDKAEMAPFAARETHVLPCTSPVLQAQFVAFSDRSSCGVNRLNADSISGFALCSMDSVSIWNLDGERTKRFAKPGSLPIVGFAVSADGSLVLAGGSGRISVWALGKNALSAGDPLDTQPLVEYPADEVDDLDVALDRLWFVHVQEQVKIVVSSLAPQEEDRPVGRSYPANELVHEEDIRELVDMVHPSNVTAMVLVEDPDDGEVVMTGTIKGVVHMWDLEGHDAGEKVAELRSMTWMEIVKPQAIMYFSYTQLASVAFTPSVPWSSRVEAPSHAVVHVTSFDIRGLAEHFSLEDSTIFWVNSLGAVMLMSLFLLIAVTSVPTKLKQFRYHIRHWNTWKREKELNSKFGPAHGFEMSALGLITLLKIFMTVCSSVMVVPIAKKVAQVVHCHYADDGSNVVFLAPNIGCYEGNHLLLVVVVSLIFPCFFYTLIPFFTVSGDSDYVQWSEIINPNTWKKNAERWCGCAPKGYMQPWGDNFFKQSVRELLVSIMMPVVSVHTAHRPILGMACLSCVTAISLAVGMTWRRYYFDLYNRIGNCMGVFLLCTMLTGLYSAVLDDKTRTEPLWFFGGLCAGVAVYTCYVCVVDLRSERRVLSLKSGRATAVAKVSAVPARQKDDPLTKEVFSQEFRALFAKGTAGKEAKLGLDLNTTDGVTLCVDAIVGGGLAEAWNKGRENGPFIEAGDQIVSANGLRGDCYELKETILNFVQSKRLRDLLLVIRKPARIRV